MPTNAATIPRAQTFQDALQLLDHFYDYNAEYMLRFANDQFIDRESFGWETYNVFYQHITYYYPSDVLPESTAAWE